MKAEERKPLEGNELVQQITRAYDTVKQGPSRGMILYGAIAVAVVLVAWLSISLYRSSEAATSGRWRKLDDVVFLEQLKTSVDDTQFAETPQGRLLRFRDARVNLSLGLEELGSKEKENQTRARERIEKAREEYTRLKEIARQLPPLLHQEALLGAAKAHEALGEINEAIDAYKLLVKEYPQSSLAADAKKQQQRLESTEGARDARELANALKPKS